MSAMRIAIAGATRGIGRCLVEQGVVNGHHITAMGRHIEKMPLRHEHLRTLRGNVTRPGDASSLVAAQDAVCFTAGIDPTLKKVTLYSKGTAALLQAMSDQGISRLIAVTGIGAGESRGHGGFLYDCIVLPLLLRTIYRDKDRQEKMIQNSSLKWTIVRPGFLSNGPLTGDYRVIDDLNGVKAGRISRSNVAHFILQELENDRYLHQAVLLTS